MSKKPRGSEDLNSLVGQAMDGIVDEAAQVLDAGREEIARQERRERRNAVLAITLIPLALILTALNVGGYGIMSWAAGPPALSAAETQLAATEILSDAVDELQWAWEEEGRYPARPGFLPPDAEDDEPFTYELMASDHYVLTVTIDGFAATFNSHDDADEVFREVRSAR